ncbi:MAG: HDOD domain-containing protein [candidate division Zixibacteria bacterium]|nr:HDOD domain-containing protein [candidate division Zixibacteria bacterium]MBU1471355.1 HDOD domain-containing protein [candidate division Zixibacteria bacterium]
MTESRIFSRIEREHRLFTLPEVLAQVIRIAEDPSSSIRDIANIISRDVTLTSKILKMANSSFYGRPNQVQSIHDALGVLGTRTVKSIALSVSVYDICNRLSTQVDMKDFWLHSLEVAILAELIAKAVGYKSAEEAFVSGLLHDVGILILDSAFKKEYESIWQRCVKGDDLISTEESELGTNHAQIGAFVAARWNLPLNYQACIRDHHRAFDMVQPNPDSRLVNIVALASRLGKFSVHGHVFTGKRDVENRIALIRSLGLSSEVLTEIEKKAVTNFMETASFLEIDVGTPLELAQRANELMNDMFGQLELLYRQLSEHHERLPIDKIDTIATDVMYTVVATFSHYFNNACATILGRSQLVELALDKGEVSDSASEILRRSIGVIQSGVESISNVLSVMRSVESFQTVQYHESAKIIDLKEQLDKLVAKRLDPVSSI